MVNKLDFVIPRFTKVSLHHSQPVLCLLRNMLTCAFTWARFGVALLVIGWFIHLRATTRGRTGFDIGAFDETFACSTTTGGWTLREKKENHCAKTWLCFELVMKNPNFPFIAPPCIRVHKISSFYGESKSSNCGKSLSEAAINLISAHVNCNWWSVGLLFRCGHV